MTATSRLVTKLWTSIRASGIAGRLRDDIKVRRFAVWGALGCLCGAILGELLLAFTRPAPPVRNICLLIDCSGSMLQQGPENMFGLNKLLEVKSAARAFVVRQGRGSASRDQLAVVGFGSNVKTAARLTHDTDLLARSIDDLADGGSTNMAAGLLQATGELPERSDRSASAKVDRSILLFTDGQPDDQAAASLAARTALSRGIRVVAIGTGDAKSEFLAKITGDPRLVFSVGSGNFNEGFAHAEEAIRSGSLVQKQPGEGGSGRSFALLLGWTALITTGAAFALILGQNQYLQRPALPPKELGMALAGSIVAGIVAGAAGQLLFGAATRMAGSTDGSQIVPALVTGTARLVGWSILGALTARGLALFIPNLQPRYAWIGGAIGGLLGAVAFMVASTQSELAGRLLGSTVLGALIGMMLAWAELASRHAWLEVRFGHKEKVQISLGADLVKVGSGRVCAVYVRDARPLALAYRFSDGAVECIDYATEQTSPRKNGEQTVLGTVTITVRTSSAIEASSPTCNTASGSDSPSLAPRPPVPKVPAQNLTSAPSAATSPVQEKAVAKPQTNVLLPPPPKRPNPLPAQTSPKQTPTPQNPTVGGPRTIRPVPPPPPAPRP